MRRFIFPLLAALALPTAVNAESVWLILRYSPNNRGVFAADLEKVEMKDMDQCEFQGAIFRSSKRINKLDRRIGFECIEGK